MENEELQTQIEELKKTIALQQEELELIKSGTMTDEDEEEEFQVFGTPQEVTAWFATPKRNKKYKSTHDLITKDLANSNFDRDFQFIFGNYLDIAASYYTLSEVYAPTMKFIDEDVKRKTLLARSVGGRDGILNKSTNVSISAGANIDHTGGTFTPTEEEDQGFNFGGIKDKFSGGLSSLRKNRRDTG